MSAPIPTQHNLMRDARQAIYGMDRENMKMLARDLGRWLCEDAAFNQERANFYADMVRQDKQTADDAEEASFEKMTGARA